MTGRISRLFVLEGRLRSGWRVGLYLFLYVVGLLMVQVPMAILYVAFLMLQGVGDVSEMLAAVQPDRLTKGHLQAGQVTRQRVGGQ